MPPQELRYHVGAADGRAPAAGPGPGAGDEDVVSVRYRHRRDGSFEVDVQGAGLPDGAGAPGAPGTPGGAGPGDSGSESGGSARPGTARLHDVAGTRVDVELDGRRVQLDVRHRGSRWLVQGPDGTVELVALPRFPARIVEGPAGGLHAPMPGKVLATRVATGDHVRAGQLLVILEAMKMEHHITAPEDGTVAELRVVEGDQVDNGALLLVLEAD
jgi:biotin carboxyl carrier protein